MKRDFFKSKKIVILALVSMALNTAEARVATKELVNLGQFPSTVRKELQKLRDVANKVRENKAKNAAESAQKPADSKTKDLPTKDLGEVIKAATCRTTLEKGLREHGYDVIADAFKDVTTQIGALTAYLSMEEPWKSKLKDVFTNHKNHLENILGL